MIFFKKYSKLEKDLKKYDIKNYIINNDGSITVNGDVVISDEDITILPFKFKYVSGYLYLANNKLMSLYGCPEEVGYQLC
jgi:hypothetical protein